MAADTGAQGWWYGVRSWKVWAQGFGSGWTGIMGYGAMYWTPLIVHYILQGKLGPGTTKRDLNRQGAPAWHRDFAIIDRRGEATRLCGVQSCRASTI